MENKRPDHKFGLSEMDMLAIKQMRDENAQLKKALEYAKDCLRENALEWMQDDFAWDRIEAIEKGERDGKD